MKQKQKGRWHICFLWGNEKNHLNQQELLARYHKPLICFTMNICGPIKDSPLIRRGFARGRQLLRQQFLRAKLTPLYQDAVLEVTGCEAFYVLDADPLTIKKFTTDIEDATLGGYLLKDADRGIVKIVEDKQPGAKDVETRYETIAVSGRLALLKVQLITGRTHQIRAHMASIGCPILGDSKYGNNTANRELKLKYQALCAWELTMPHFNQPDFEFLSGKTFHAPKPWYYQQVLDGTLK